MSRFVRVRNRRGGTRYLGNSGKTNYSRGLRLRNYGVETLKDTMENREQLTTKILI